MNRNWVHYSQSYELKNLRYLPTLANSTAMPAPSPEISIIWIVRDLKQIIGCCCKCNLLTSTSPSDDNKGGHGAALNNNFLSSDLRILRKRSSRLSKVFPLLWLLLNSEVAFGSY